MKKLFLFIAIIIMVSCNNNPEKQIENILKDVVIENGSGMISDYESLSMEFDTVRVSDIKQFIEKCFPAEKYPNGVPADFKDEKFLGFIAPLKAQKADNDIVYLSVKHKYKILNLLIDKKIEVIQQRLLDPTTYKYIGDDLRMDKTWMGVIQYEMDKASDELDKILEKY